MPFQDVLLAAVAIDQGIEIGTYDAHFKMIQGVTSKLKLFDGPRV